MATPTRPKPPTKPPTRKTKPKTNRVKAMKAHAKTAEDVKRGAWMLLGQTLTARLEALHTTDRDAAIKMLTTLCVLEGDADELIEALRVAGAGALANDARETFDHLRARMREMASDWAPQ